ncbi:MAG: FAD-dependent oxidoreductase [Bryobacterales bacterium]|nr:FAD-dependent oxidoreductase [Bryobacterales bacterium]
MSSVTVSLGYAVTLASRHEVGIRTLAFEVTRPRDFQFVAGQTADLTWIDPPETDDEGNTRTFSIASAPHEPRLMFATRLRDTAFKRVLEKTALGSALRMEGPFGNLTLHNNAKRPAVLIAGGIGITPFRSIVRSAMNNKLPHKILLFYANKSVETAPFLDEFTAIAKEHPNFTFIPVVDEPPPSWSGEKGHISAEMITRRLKDITSEGSAGPICYVAGPPPMVASIRVALKKAEIDPDDIRTEDFSGY